MLHAEASPAAQVSPIALELVAETLRQADGLPPIELKFTTTIDGEPLVLVETLDAIEWAHHLHLRPEYVDTSPNSRGEARYGGLVNGVRWAVMYCPDQPIGYVPTDWTGPVHATQAFPAVAS